MTNQTTEPVRTKEKIVFDDPGSLQVLLGQSSQNLKVLEQAVGADIHVRGNELTVIGGDDDVRLTKVVLDQLYGFARAGNALGMDDIARAVAVLRSDSSMDLRDIFSDTVYKNGRSKPITPKGLAQKRYVEAIRQSDVVFGIGPAGTGKTYLAMALAVAALTSKKVKRIIMTRPAVEAGERLGFLPGSLEEKVNPYLRPLYDALHDMLDFERVEQMMERGIIEVAPLAFMRGRTLNDAFVVLDEAQNSTSEQMKMFLTRLGFGSRAVITGDVTQSDLPSGQRSGLREVRDLLTGIKGISFCYFSEIDVVRHPLVQKIIVAYEKAAATDT